MSNTVNNHGWRVKLVNWVKTTRVQTSMVTALSLWIGYVSVAPLTIESALLLGLIGLLVHIWGFTLNEVEDYKYDKEHGEAEGHPIAQGKVDKRAAKYLSWVSAVGAIGISLLTPYRIEGTIVLVASFIPGYLYNKYSKRHWWSNFYLSAWALLMVLSGGLYAGGINQYTILLSVAVSIQIFVQVIQGDLKDLEGEENTLAGKIGASIDELKPELFEPVNADIDMQDYHVRLHKILTYPKHFSWTLYGLKLLEAAILIYIALTAVSSYSTLSTIYFVILAILVAVFIITVDMFLVYRYDRDEIKQKASVHELTSILFIGMAVIPLDLNSAILIGLAPIVWYITINHLIHSNALNPDI